MALDLCAVHGMRHESVVDGADRGRRCTDRDQRFVVFILVNNDRNICYNGSYISARLPVRYLPLCYEHESEVVLGWEDSRP